MNARKLAHTHTHTNTNKFCGSACNLKQININQYLIHTHNLDMSIKCSKSQHGPKVDEQKEIYKSMLEVIQDVVNDVADDEGWYVVEKNVSHVHTLSWLRDLTHAHVHPHTLSLAHSHSNNSSGLLKQLIYLTQTTCPSL